ncbi:histone chaperone ASF1-like [Raphanus sativus]|uniref:Histone chaperone ASF1-like n=1 Tax=Raphanus sativus TaxID=3726 RepID=A0A6J0NRZ0_RAPSA|nr:histone chaperone ASF1-like [Raphanus sativus]KAJ4893714.1 histone chaperone ASF1-like [Raphanus sativus]
MKELRYVYDRYDEEMCQLRSASKSGIDVVEVFVEHECSEHISGVIELKDNKQDDAECRDEEEEHSENDEVDRPKEDDEPEESEDENPAEKETGEEDNPTVNPLDNEAGSNENLNDNDEAGDEVVVDVIDGARDVRFLSVFEEGQKIVPDKEAYGNGLQEEEKDDDSEDERAPE